MALLRPWAVYSDHPATWPQSRGRTFLPAAVAALADALFSLSAEEIDAEMSAGEPCESGYIVDFFADLIRKGNLTTYVRPFGRTGAQLLQPDAWDSDRVIDIISTGCCARPANLDGPANHHVFLRSVEVDAIVDCYGPCLDHRGEIGHTEFERRLDAILASLRGVPEPGQKLRFEDPTPLMDRFPNARIELNSTDIQRLVDMGREWLERKLEDPANANRRREHFEQMALEEFNPLMNTTRFGYVWKDTVALERFTHWNQPGRRAGRSDGRQSD